MKLKLALAAALLLGTGAARAADVSSSAGAAYATPPVSSFMSSAVAAPKLQATERATMRHKTGARGPPSVGAYLRISSAAQSNAFSVNHSLDLSEATPGVNTKVAFAANVALPGTKYDVASKSVLLTGPVDVKLHQLTATFTV